MEFISENLGTIVVAAVLAVAVIAIVASLVRKKRAGGCACGCTECGGCGKHCQEDGGSR